MKGFTNSQVNTSWHSIFEFNSNIENNHFQMIILAKTKIHMSVIDFLLLQLDFQFCHKNQRKKYSHN